MTKKIITFLGKLVKTMALIFGGLVTLGMLIVIAHLGREFYKQNHKSNTQTDNLPFSQESTGKTEIKDYKTSQPRTNTTQSNLTNCTGPDGVVFKTTQQECDNFNNAWGNASETDNSNEYIKCNIAPECGGGYKEMTRSTCNEMICCQGFDFNWQLTSKKECEQSREIYVQNLEAQYPLPSTY